MRMFFQRNILLVLLFTACTEINAQCPVATPLSVQNPSFEGPTGIGITPSPWNNCMPGQTPDTQPGNWGVNLPPTNGSTYLGLVHQVSAAWQEGASEPLSAPMTAGVQYTFPIDLANSSATGGGIIPGCAECQIWGGYGLCDKNTLLWSSGNITPYDVWQTYTVTFTATQAFSWLLIQVNSLGCTDLPYILVDNIGAILPANVSTTAIVSQNILCAGATDGIATVHAVGQNGPFTYQWSTSPVQIDSVLDNVAAGTYTVTVTDALSCSATSTVTLTEPQPIVLTPTVVPVTCYGYSTGSAYLSYAGGTPPMTFNWSNGAGNVQNNQNLFAGTLNVTVTDANNCSVQDSIVIPQPTALTVSGNSTNVTCMGGNDGSIASVVSGGTSPYSIYQWNTTPAQNTANANNLTAGNYTLSVTDSAGCQASANFTVTEPPNGASIAFTVTHVFCYGNSTGAITTTVAGGATPYAYQWNTSNTTPNLSNVPAGIYTLTVTDGNNCPVADTANIMQPPTPVSATTTTTDILCFGNNSGTATVTAGGGIPGYTYVWSTSPVQHTAIANNLNAGSYTVIVADSLNCTASSTVIINQPASGLTLSTTKTDVLCFGDNTGSATVSTSGGSPRYSFSWNTNPAQTTATADSLVAGTYTVIVTDTNNCSASISAIISEPAAPLTVNLAVTAPVCAGQSLAAISSSVTGGTTAYSYLWNTTPAQNTAAVSNLNAGSYTITVTDANGCSATANATVAAPPSALSVSMSVTDVICYGASTGSISATATGSYGNYSYTWSTTPTQNTATAVQLAAGIYMITITDVQGCSITASDTVAQPNTAITATAAGADVLCFGEATGSASVSATGGTPGYTYLWNTSPQQTLTNAVSLVSGNYQVTVTDANACSVTAQVPISQPATPLSVSSALQQIDCYGNANGGITISVSGGTPVYAYAWSTVLSANLPSVSSLAPGSYSVSVTDNNNCSVELNNLLITEPSALVLNPLIADESCLQAADGSIDANGSGGVPPLNYVWNIGGGSQIIQHLTAGNYTVTLSDNNNCSTSAIVPVAQLQGVSLAASVNNVLCFPLTNGSVAVAASSSFLPLQYSWSNGEHGAAISNLDTGTYSVTVTDAHHCLVDTSFHVGNDSAFSLEASPHFSTIDLGQAVSLQVSSTGNSINNIVWMPAHGLSCTDCSDPVSSPVQSTTYFVTAMDINGCIATDTARVEVVPKYIVFLPNAFTPNGDGVNDFFEVFGNKDAWKQFEVKVFNRIGEKVFESNDMNFKWDGRYKGILLNPAVFVYTAKVVYLDNYSEKLYKGSITLIR